MTPIGLERALRESFVHARWAKARGVNSVAVHQLSDGIEVVVAIQKPRPESVTVSLGMQELRRVAEAYSVGDFLHEKIRDAVAMCGYGPCKRKSGIVAGRWRAWLVFDEGAA